MAKEDGTWIMRGLDWDDPARIQSWQELTGWGDEVGFLPLFRNGADWRKLPCGLYHQYT